MNSNLNSVMHISRRRLLALALCGLSATASAQSARVKIRILFLGNSYTFHNDMPGMVSKILAATGDFSPETAGNLKGSYSWEHHVSDPDVASLLQRGASDGRPWDVVVLQESSVLSAVAAVNQPMRRAVQRNLHTLANAAHLANPNVLVLVMQNWARHQHLWESKDDEERKVALATGDSSADAHARIRETFADVTRAVRDKVPALNLVLCPVGDFWKLAAAEHPALALHHEDGSHPSRLGTWFASLTLAASIGGRATIEKSDWTDSISKQDAGVLKKLLLDHPEVFRSAGK